MLSKFARNNLVRFLNQHFRDASENFRGGYYEWRFQCPFCNGGDHGDVSFDMNIDKGVGRCWRATCDWKGGAAYFISKLTDMSVQEAKEYLDIGGEVSDKSIKVEFDFLDQIFSEKYAEVEISNDRIEMDIDGAVPLSESRNSEEIYDWITGVRRYELQPFLQSHTIFVPYQIGKGNGRVLFIVQTNDDYAYIYYAFQQGVMPKTLNPPGQVLSRMLYNYNSAQNGRYLFVTEGLFDCARLISWGFSAVACFGVSPQKAQMYLLSKTKAEEIIVCFDNGAEDKAKAAVSQMKEFISDKVLSYMVIEKEGADPDDLTQEEFLKFFSKRRRLIKKDLNKTMELLDGLNFG